MHVVVLNNRLDIDLIYTRLLFTLTYLTYEELYSLSWVSSVYLSLTSHVLNLLSCSCFTCVPNSPTTTESFSCTLNIYIDLISDNPKSSSVTMTCKLCSTVFAFHYSIVLCNCVNDFVICQVRLQVNWIEGSSNQA